MNKCFYGDCRAVMQGLLDQGMKGKIQTVVTSPPYWGLRDYGVEGQIGLEDSLEEYTKSILSVFGLARDLLADDGVIWVNLGDSYATGTTSDRKQTATGKHGYWQNPGVNKRIDGRAYGLKPKDLVGIPWMVAFALRADGWYLRSDIIWSKPNPMPESVTDRPTKSHEYLFLLSKSSRYYYDADAIAEPVVYGHEAKYDPGTNGLGGDDRKTGKTTRRFSRSGNKERKPAAERGYPGGQAASIPWEGVMRNKRTVWTITSQPYSGPHFATFPPKLIEPCIMAGSRVGDIVLDPFFGSGTTGEVCELLGRQWIGIELNEKYRPLIEERTAQMGIFNKEGT